MFKCSKDGMRALSQRLGDVVWKIVYVEHTCCSKCSCKLMSMHTWNTEYQSSDISGSCMYAFDQRVNKLFQLSFIVGRSLTSINVDVVLQLLLISV